VPTLLIASAIGLAANFAALLVPSIRNMRRLETDPATIAAGESSVPITTGGSAP